MSFLFRFFTSERQESRIKEFQGDSVTIGRGGGSDLLLVSRIVRLEHARLTLSGGELSIKLLSPSAPLFVNNKPTSGRRIEAGDEFTVGNIHFTVAAIVDDAAEIHCIETEVVEATRELVRKSLLPHAFSTPYRLGLELAILTALIAGALPVFSDKWSFWSTGPLTSRHASLEQNCSACHDSAFSRIDDKACSSCHKLTEHSAELTSLVAHQKIAGAQCADCHKEHRSEAELTVKASGLCVSCHGHLEKFGSEVAAPNIASFVSHPEFQIKQLDGKDGTKKISLGDVNVKDPGTIKLNHKVHLKAGLRSADGEVTLTCISCHAPSPDLKGFIPVSFEKNCRSCHPLTFDDRLPASEVPHGDTEAVYRYLLGEYSKFAAFGDSTTNQESVRSIPGKGKPEAPPAAVIKEARRAETVLYTRTSCQTCHEVEEISDANNWSARFNIKEANINSVWFTNARFNHAAHVSQKCISCHDGVSTSTATSDVLLPKIAECQSCHAQAGSTWSLSKGMIPTECSTCHAYHESKFLGAGIGSEADVLLNTLHQQKR